MKFNEMNLPAFIVEALDKNNITEPTAIQEQCISEIRDGKDIVGISKTGSGKTFAYAIPAIEKLDDEAVTQALVICPTRELAVQVSDEIRKITSFQDNCKVVAIYGGSHMDKQITSLKKGAKIVVGTPGRLMDHLRRRTLKLDKLKMAVLDEADEMMDMGFKDDMREILSHANVDRQTVMFSATMPTEVLNLTKTFMRQPVTVDCIDQAEAQSFIEQHYVCLEKAKKNEGAAQLMKDLNPSRAIVFCNTKGMVDELTEYFSRNFIKAVGLHGDMRQSERRNAMNAVKKGVCTVLVATDVAARGLDLKDVEFVLNYDIPNDDDFYIHRIGRTARAGKTGAAFTLITGRGDLNHLMQLMKKTGNEASEHVYSFTADFKKKQIKPDGFAQRKDVFKKGKTHVTAKGKGAWSKDKEAAGSAGFGQSRNAEGKSKEKGGGYWQKRKAEGKFKEKSAEGFSQNFGGEDKPKEKGGYWQKRKAEDKDQDKKGGGLGQSRGAEGKPKEKGGGFWKNHGAEGKPKEKSGGFKSKGNPNNFAPRKK